MRRLLVISGVILAAILALLVVRNLSGDSNPYLVRAVFDNGAFVVPDVDVRVAGANVGSVDSVDVSLPGEVVSDDPADPTRPGKAIIVMKIDDPDFRDFRDNASCIIRPQSLIGEKFIDCQVTEPRPPGTEPPPELAMIPGDQPGAGQRLLPIENNGRSVDQDLINNIYRLPYAQRFRIILNELGVGLATRGPELRETITRANPTLMEVNKVLKILASQNKRLAELARNGDNNLTRLAARRKQLVGFFREAGFTAAATAERSEDMRENLRLLPQTLRELRSTFAALETFTGDARPVFAALRPSAKDISQVTQQLAPFARASNVSFQSLARATRSSLPDLLASVPIVGKLGDQARAGKKPTTDLDFLLKSTREASGFRNLMLFFYNTGSALSGYDQFGHYQRTNVLVTGCSEYKVISFSDCPAQWEFTAQSLSATAREVLPELGSGGIAPESLGGLEGAVPEADEPVPPFDPSIPGGPSEPGATEEVPGLDSTEAGDGDVGPEVGPAGTSADDPAPGRRAHSRVGNPRRMTQMAILDYLLGR
jgi:phospholipid/cholesterol/gamma-HCH transport system substrate-binding protein